MKNGHEINLVGFIKLITDLFIELLYDLYLSFGKKMKVTWAICHIKCSIKFPSLEKIKKFRNTVHSFLYTI